MKFNRRSALTASAVGVLALALAATAALAGRAVGEKPTSNGAGLGQPAPSFALTDQDGKTVNLSELRGKVVVVEWFNNECPYVVKHYKAGHMNALAAKYAGQGVTWLAINSTSGKDNTSNKAIAGEWKIDRPILNDATGATGKAYGARTTPHMFVINKDGIVVYKGAIDSNGSSDTKDIEGATNHVAAALDEVLAGKAVSVPETRPYGCSVKYAK
jgi:peroxiredoxin